MIMFHKGYFLLFNNFGYILFEKYIFLSSNSPALHRILCFTVKLKQAFMPSQAELVSGLNTLLLGEILSALIMVESTFVPPL